MTKQEIEEVLTDLKRADDFPIARVVEALEKLDVHALGVRPRGMTSASRRR